MLLHAEAYREVEPLMKTTYERGIDPPPRRASGGRPCGKWNPVRPVVCRSQATGRGVVAGGAGPPPDRSPQGTVSGGTPPGRLKAESFADDARRDGSPPVPS